MSTEKISLPAITSSESFASQNEIAPWRLTLARYGRICAAAAGPLAFLSLFLPFLKVQRGGGIGFAIVNALVSIIFGKTIKEKQDLPPVVYTGWELLSDYPFDLLLVVGVVLAALGVLSVWWWRGKPGLVGWRALLTLASYPFLFHFLMLFIALAALFYPTEFHLGAGVMFVAFLIGFAGAAAHTAALTTRRKLADLYTSLYTGLKSPFGWRMPR